MTLIRKKFYTIDKRHVVEIRQRKDSLWEVEGFSRATDLLPDGDSYIFMQGVLGVALTDSLLNAEKLALETIAALSGEPAKPDAYTIVTIEEEIPVFEPPPLPPEKTAVSHPPEIVDARFKDMLSWNVDKDYKPERTPSLKDHDLIPRARKVLEKITTGGKSIYSVEVCDTLILIGKNLEIKGRLVEACCYWYNASEIANNPWLGGWGTVSIELFRELQRRYKFENDQFKTIIPVPELLEKFIASATCIK